MLLDDGDCDDASSLLLLPTPTPPPFDPRNFFHVEKFEKKKIKTIVVFVNLSFSTIG